MWNLPAVVCVQSKSKPHHSLQNNWNSIITYSLPSRTVLPIMWSTGFLDLEFSFTTHPYSVSLRIVFASYIQYNIFSDPNSIQKLRKLNILNRFICILSFRSTPSPDRPTDYRLSIPFSGRNLNSTVVHWSSDAVLPLMFYTYVGIFNGRKISDLYCTTSLTPSISLTRVLRLIHCVGVLL